MNDDTSRPDDEDRIILLTDEDGEESEFRIVDLIKVDGKTYAILLPLKEGKEDEEGAVILRVDEEDGEDVLVEIDDEDEFDSVCQAWSDQLEAEEG